MLDIPQSDEAAVDVFRQWRDRVLTVPVVSLERGAMERTDDDIESRAPRRTTAKKRAVQGDPACNDYLRMGPNRSLRRVHDGYPNTRKDSHVSSVYTMRRWCEVNGWQKLAEEYDAQIDVTPKSWTQNDQSLGYDLGGHLGPLPL